MMIPYPYDWVSGWTEKYQVVLPEAAHKELINWLIHIDMSRTPHDNIPTEAYDQGYADAMRDVYDKLAQVVNAAKKS